MQKQVLIKIKKNSRKKQLIILFGSILALAALAQVVWTLVQLKSAIELEGGSFVEAVNRNKQELIEQEVK